MYNICVAFEHYAKTATRNGGFWVSPAGGTTNVVAGEIARATGYSFEEVVEYVDYFFGGNASQAFICMAGNGHAPDAEWEPRFDARIIIRAAIRAARGEG